MSLKRNDILKDPVHKWQSFRVIEVYQFTVALKRVSKYAQANPILLYELTDIENMLEENELELDNTPITGDEDDAPLSPET